MLVLASSRRIARAENLRTLKIAPSKVLVNDNQSSRFIQTYRNPSFFPVAVILIVQGDARTQFVICGQRLNVIPLCRRMFHEP